MRGYVVTAAWDAESGMWYVADSDIPGLCTEAPSFEALVERVAAVAPDLIELNGLSEGEGQVPLTVTASRQTSVALH